VLGAIRKKEGMTRTSSGLPHPGRHNKSLDASGISGLVIDNLPLTQLSPAASSQPLGAKTNSPHKERMMEKKMLEDILAAYKRKYPRWTNTEVTGVFENVSGGYLAVVKSDQFPDSEICFYEKDKPYIFETTLELAKELERRYKSKLDINLLFMFFLATVVLGLFVYLVIYQGNKEAITTLISGFVGIMGYFFGSKNAKQST
jgi:hypothetical protein